MSIVAKMGSIGRKANRVIVEEQEYKVPADLQMGELYRLAGKEFYIERSIFDIDKLCYFYETRPINK